MALTPGNIKCGGMRWYWDTPGSEVELGLCTEGSELVIEKGMEPVPSEQYGIAPVDFVLMGERASLTINLLEWKNEALLIALLGSTQSTGPTTRAWQFGSMPGVLASTLAKQLRGHLVTVANQATYTTDLVLYKAVPRWKGEPIKLGNAPSIIPVVFECIVDTSKSDGNLLGRYRTDAA